MGDRLDDRLTEAAKAWLGLGDRIGQARRAQHDARRGQPRSASTAPGRASGPSSPVEAALEEPDHGGRAAVASEKARLAAALALEAEVRRVREWAPHQPGKAARWATESDPGMLCDEPGCNRPARTKAATDVGGRLVRAKVLCAAHYQHIVRTRQPRRDRT